MPDLLIRNIDPHLKRQLQESARSHRRSLHQCRVGGDETAAGQSSHCVAECEVINPFEMI